MRFAWIVTHLAGSVDPRSWLPRDATGVESATAAIEAELALDRPLSGPSAGEPGTGPKGSRGPPASGQRRRYLCSPMQSYANLPSPCFVTTQVPWPLAADSLPVPPTSSHLWLLILSGLPSLSSATKEYM